MLELVSGIDTVLRILVSIALFNYLVRANRQLAIEDMERWEAMAKQAEKEGPNVRRLRRVLQTCEDISQEPVYTDAERIEELTRIKNFCDVLIQKVRFVQPDDVP